MTAQAGYSTPISRIVVDHIKNQLEATGLQLQRLFEFLPFDEREPLNDRDMVLLAALVEFLDGARKLHDGLAEQVDARVDAFLHGLPRSVAALPSFDGGTPHDSPSVGRASEGSAAAVPTPLVTAAVPETGAS